MLNKLRCHAQFYCQPIRLLDSDYWYKFTYWMTKLQFQISWLLQKLTDLDLHGLLRSGHVMFSKRRVKRTPNVLIWRRHAGPQAVLESMFAFWPRDAKKCLRSCAKCAYSHHLAHAQSLIRAFALHWNILQYQMILFSDNEGPDQAARMRRLIWAFADRICPQTLFEKCIWENRVFPTASRGYQK